MYVIETQDLTKYYNRGKIKALESVSLRVEKGKIFSLLGPNGAGKTTLIKLLLGIVFPTRGSGALLGKHISDHSSHSRIGYLAENHRFPEFLTARQILFYYGRMSGVENAILNEKTPQLLKMVKLEKWGDTKIRKFSKGMLQRMGIAQSLTNDPDLLFFDEPTDGIDPVGRREIRDILKSLRDQGKTIFLNSHLLSEVERISDEVAILKDGRLIQQGSVEEFISVKQQYKLQVEDRKQALQPLCQEMNIPLMSQNSHYIVSVTDDAHLNQLIDKMRGEQITIQGIVPRKISLEDFFIDVIEDKQEITQ
ncbi:ABC transporter ATP-binding protein [Candidatus Saccharibacteria bacterium]|nr:ABC transporter ATP-binding protein [Candidatus Saccharibacteria bacterium]NIV71202.1 ATP-binding cassette domain-containing protein [Calditrichia bacterium]NIW78084.1 ATP-binding cassette domain-containing protein [Calditrichia bacterium]